MKQFVAILLIVGIVAGVFSKLSIIFYYEFNKKYITSVLCVNKNQPQKHCEGKCHLKKQLQKDEERQNNSPSGNQEAQEIVLSGSLNELRFDFFNNHYYKLFYFYSAKRLTSIYFDIFHPPKFF